jgi:hypothetical protein
MAQGGHTGHDFSRVRVTPAPPGSFQARLTVGHPGDRFEREADLIADRVMQTSVAEGGPPYAKQVRRSPELPPNRAPTESIRRAPDESGEMLAEEGDRDSAAPNADGEAAPPAGGMEASAHSAEQLAVTLLEEDDLEDSNASQAQAERSGGADGASTVQARALPGQTPTVPSRYETAVNALRGGGSPLPAESRTFFEGRFGHDFSRVRIHTGPDAGRMARTFGARAFTIGRDMVFGTEQYQPATPAGQWLLAHELTHVVQQQEGAKQLSTGRIPIQHSGRDQVQGGFFGRLWSGIKKGAAAVAGAVKWTAGKAWKGIKWTAGKAWQGIKAVGTWGWNVLKSGAALAWSYVVNTPGRVWRLIKDLGSGVAAVASALWQAEARLQTGLQGLGKRLLDGILSGTAWALRLIGKLAYVAGIGEIWDLVFQIIKVNTRSLSSGEQSEARKVFHSSISYWRVRIDEHSLISKVGAAFKGASGLGVTTFHTINFNHKITAAAGSLDMRWLAHELAHVSQYEHAGPNTWARRSTPRPPPAMTTGPSALWRHPRTSPPTPWEDTSPRSIEQQADIAADYYYSLYHNVHPVYGFGLTTTDYEPVIDELRHGKL